MGIGQPIALQRRIVGHPANRAVFAVDGVVRAGVSLDVIEERYANGPAHTVRIIDHPGMLRTADRIVAQLGLTGIFGFDFMLSDDGTAWFLETNVRMTAACAIPIVNGVSLFTLCRDYLRDRRSGIDRVMTYEASDVAHGAQFQRDPGGDGWMAWNPDQAGEAAQP